MMSRVAVVAVALLACGAVVAAGGTLPDDHEKIEKAMKVGLKGGLNKKILEGKASAAEKEQFLTLVVAMWGTKTPRGDAASWTRKSGALIAAAAGVVAGESDALAKLKAASNCKACHSVHKPKK